ncbi:MAG TPA: hydrogenase maturation nickel metallochaperone HypA [Solirubrobacteraceae bacterium]|nr:hydrogenase maturation nickel metallochaperone HypA [Solirubrobacteraceae bacterium]
MHELSLSSAILDTATRHARGRRVTAVAVRIGALRQVVPRTLEFYFGFVTRGSVCEGAALELVVVPARLACDACALEWELAAPGFRCPRCQTAEVRICSGDELLVESIEVIDEPAPPVTWQLAPLVEPRAAPPPRAANDAQEVDACTAPG